MQDQINKRRQKKKVSTDSSENIRKKRWNISSDMMSSYKGSQILWTSENVKSSMQWEYSSNIKWEDSNASYKILLKDKSRLKWHSKHVLQWRQL